jgi:hypothetical protein
MQQIKYKSDNPAGRRLTEVNTNTWEGREKLKILTELTVVIFKSKWNLASIPNWILHQKVGKKEPRTADMFPMTNPKSGT